MVAAQFLISIVLASAAITAPSAGRLASRLERRRTGGNSQPIQRLPTPLNVNTTNTEYSSNWAGAVYDSYPAGTFTLVTGTFIVPTPTGGDGAASAWVGIDGDTCGTAILQTGLDFTISGGAVSYDAWYEWFPDYAYDFSGISFSSGDTVTVTVTASSTTSGSAVIKNKTTGVTVTQQITSTSALCEQNTEWIVEDFEEGGSLVGFADFGSVVFTGASATTTTGSIGPGSATLIDIEQNNVILTSSSVDDSSVTVMYQ
ncbi:hypothetical protein FIBSPDRAFT_912759 [Athelia psychrophila]|uniref:Acid proteinase n=1 Tax=Athelia psychrophila TaxID=1759441 RepID=A0A166DDD0_9AGAM|nr:hypothetical protein FIBSPDRAFT_912759 [Fibularhizoctonia sp. CBS 109695]